MNENSQIGNNRTNSKKSVESKDHLLMGRQSIKKLALRALSRTERIKVSDLYLEYYENCRSIPISRIQFVHRLRDVSPNLHLKYYSDKGSKWLYLEKAPCSCEKDSESNETGSI